MTLPDLHTDEIFLITYSLRATADRCRQAAKGMPKSSPSRQTNTDLADELFKLANKIINNG